MPLYEYRCQDCQHDFELLVRQDTALECPACHSHALEKQLSVFAVSTDGGRPAARAAGPGPCGSCGHPDGPGSCSIN
jgi:putative FmdB family regulatory protein